MKTAKLALFLISIVISSSVIVYAKTSIEDIDKYMNLGVKECSEGKYEQAVKDMEKALAGSPSNENIKKSIVNALIDQAKKDLLKNSYKKALKALEKAKKYAPENTQVVDLYKNVQDALNPKNKKNSQKNSKKDKAAAAFPSQNEVVNSSSTKTTEFKSRQLQPFILPGITPERSESQQNVISSVTTNVVALGPKPDPAINVQKQEAPPILTPANDVPVQHVDNTEVVSSSQTSTTGVIEVSSNTSTSPAPNETTALSGKAEESKKETSAAAPKVRVKKAKAVSVDSSAAPSNQPAAKSAQPVKITETQVKSDGFQNGDSSASQTKENKLSLEASTKPQTSHKKSVLIFLCVSIVFLFASIALNFYLKNTVDLQRLQNKADEAKIMNLTKTYQEENNNIKAEIGKIQETLVKAQQDTEKLRNDFEMEKQTLTEKLRKEFEAEKQALIEKMKNEFETEKTTLNQNFAKEIEAKVEQAAMKAKEEAASIINEENVLENL